MQDVEFWIPVAVTFFVFTVYNAGLGSSMFAKLPRIGGLKKHRMQMQVQCRKQSKDLHGLLLRPAF